MPRDRARTTRVDTRLKLALEAGALPKELVICGPAGTGKTRGILNVLHTLAADFDGLRILVCRKTRVSLTESVLRTYEEEVLPEDDMEAIAAGCSRKVRTSYHYPDSGSEIVLAGLDEPSRIASTSWDVAFVNEAIETTQEDWETVLSRLNRPGRPSYLGYLLGDTNPGDPAHWIKHRAEAGELPLWDTAHEANPAMWEGGDWTPAGLSYLATLDRMTGTRKKRFRQGLWAAGEGQWFEGFTDRHVSDSTGYNPAFPVHLAVDSGVHTAAVWFQVRPGPIVSVFGDHYTFNVPAYDTATAILAKSKVLCRGRLDVVSTDPAGRSATAVVGPTVMQEYRRAGLKADPWPIRGVTDGLALIDSFVSVDPPALLVHPTCIRLLEAFANYRRARRQGQWIDRPEDPQHPYEDVMDALRGGLQDKFPDGRKLAPAFRTVNARGGRLR